jgi:calcium/calmodulin-dependent protein kinase I
MATMKLRHADKIEDLYMIGAELGSGGFAVVKKGKDRKDGTEWALKLITIQMYNKNKAMMDDEVRVLQGLEHPNIVQLREVVITKAFFCIVMELLSGRELFDRIVEREKYNEQDAKGVAIEILESIKFLHSQRVVHRDLKPENLIFKHPGDEAKLKLTDFGFAVVMQNSQRLTQSCGTPEYVAPEIIDGLSYTEKVDVWSAGVIVYILLCGFPPFYGDSDEELYDKISRGKFEFLVPYWNNVSNEAKDLIQKMLTVNPNKRLSADQALQHPWFGLDHTRGGDLGNARSEMQRFQALRKFRKGVFSVLAANKIKFVLQSK